jgi:hypothetical protein
VRYRAKYAAWAAGACAFGVTLTMSAGATPAQALLPVPLGAGGWSPADGPVNQMPPQLIVPDLIAATPMGVTQAQVERIRKLAGVRGVLPVSGGEIKVNGQAATVMGAPLSALRAWTPPTTAGDDSLWAQVGKGSMIPSAQGAKRLGLKAGKAYPVAGMVATNVTATSPALLAMPGVDAVVDAERASQLGLIKNVAVLVNAPGADLDKLAATIRSILGSSGHVVRLVSELVPQNLPVDSKVGNGTPTTYMQLFQESAARYCPKLSWTVLAAIGEIESADGQNMGPSSAGALGPMQFMPSTWAIWGIDAFGETGPPNIMDPLDAVPSAARMLCSDGAALGGASLSRAIFDYNHATWYVTEVLDLAAEYGHEYTG